MKKIRIKKIILQNFKGFVEQRIFEFNEKNANIVGANGKGKTTIYKAYYWCLTGKTLEPNDIILPIIENIISRQKVSVRVILSVDNNDIDILREQEADIYLNEDGIEVIKGYTQRRYINDTELSVKKFNERLATIIPDDILIFVFNPAIFMRMTVAEKRRFILSLTDTDSISIDETYPFLSKEIKKGMSYDEITESAMARKKKISSELSDIKAKIQMIDSMSKEIDITKLKEEKTEIDKELYSIFEAAVNGEDYEKNKEAEQIITILNDEILSIKDFVKQQRNDISNLLIMMEQSIIKYMSAQNRLDEENLFLAKIKEKHTYNIDKFQAIKKDWLRLNEDAHAKCEVCGCELSEEDRENIKDIIYHNAQEIQEVIVQQKGIINEHEKIIRENLKEKKEASIIALKDNIISIKEVLMRQYPCVNSEKRLIKKKQYDKNRTLDALLVKKQNIESRIAEAMNIQTLNLQRQELTKQALQKTQELASIAGLCNDIKNYTLAEIEMKEKKINALFQNVSWSFYERNLSNGELKEICLPKIDGIDINSTNTAKKIYGLMEVCDVVAKRFDTSFPVFIDGKESVEKLPMTVNQIITLEHRVGEPLNINF